MRVFRLVDVREIRIRQREKRTRSQPTAISMAQHLQNPRLLFRAVPAAAIDDGNKHVTGNKHVRGVSPVLSACRTCNSGVGNEVPFDIGNIGWGTRFTPLPSRL